MNNYQTEFRFFKGKKLRARFNGGDISSDSGLPLIKEFENKIGLIKKATDSIEDKRDHRYIDHTLEEILNQRIFQIIAGYEDCNDSDLLRKDSCFKAIAGRKQDDQDLSSQPTLSRLENSISRTDIVRLMKLLVNNFLDSFNSPPSKIVLDIDSTDDPTHGRQQMSLFHGYYHQYQYLPLIISSNKHLLGAILRRGTSGNGKHVNAFLKTLIPMIRIRFPKVKIIIRCDAGFSTPRFYEYLESIDNLEYFVGIGGNAVLKEKSKAFRHIVLDQYKKTGEPQRQFDAFQYGATTWNKQRKVIVKAEFNDLGSNARYVVTNSSLETAESIYDYYADRGDSERWIGELKNGFKADRLSCHRFIANQFRLLLHGIAYEIMAMFNEKILEGTELFSQSIDTIRKKIIKVGAQITLTARCLWFRLASGYPFQKLFVQLHKKILFYQH